MSGDSQKQNKLLAEWFWTDRWMGSSAFLLPLEPRGLYREMMTQAWRRGCRLPADHEAIQRAVGCTKSEWNRCWPQIDRYWRLDGSEYVNDTQLEVWADAKAAQERASARGRAGAQARAQARAQAQREQVNEDKPPSPSPVQVPPHKPAGEPPRGRAGVMAGMLPRDHLNCHAPCERICVSERQFSVFVQQFGGDDVAASAAVEAFIADVRRKLPLGPIGDRSWDFWAKQFAATFPSAAPADARKPAAAAVGSGRLGAANAAAYDIGKGRDDHRD